MVKYVGDHSHCLDHSIMGGVCDLREEVSHNRTFIKDAECNVRADIKDSACHLTENVKDAECSVRRDIAKEGGETRRDVKMTESNLKDILSLNFCDLGKMITRAEYETKLGVQTVIKEVNLHTDNRANRIEDKLENGFDKVGDKLCAFERRVDDKFCALREQHLEQENRELRDKLSCCKERNQTQELLRAICCGCGEGGPGNSGK